MLASFWPILLVVGANTLYNLCAKATPSGVNAFASLGITYLVGAALSVLCFYCTAPQKNLLLELSKTNWTAYAFGFAVVLLEFGYINIYRAGWKMGVASLIANIGLACVLLTLGVLLFKEAISLRQIIGVLVCGGGLLLVCK